VVYCVQLNWKGGENVKKNWYVAAGVLLFMIHMAVIYEDAQAIINDPNENNKPGEVLKLILDISRYFPK